jgi:hypothetical protein
MRIKEYYRQGSEISDQRISFFADPRVATEEQLER